MLTCEVLREHNSSRVGNTLFRGQVQFSLDGSALFNIPVRLMHSDKNDNDFVAWPQRKREDTGQYVNVMWVEDPLPALAEKAIRDFLASNPSAF